MRVTMPAGYASLTEVRLFPDEERTGTAAAILPLVEDPAVEGVYVADGVTVDPGRYYITVAGVLSNDDPGTFSYRHVDLPERDDMVISPEALAVKAGMDLPLTESQREVITDAILDAQADVQAYLGRSLFPVERIDYERFPWDDGWNLDSGDETVIRIISTTPEYQSGTLTGTYTVKYIVGLDVANDPALRPIHRYIVAHALNSDSFLRMWRTATNDEGTVRSLSAEGQSVSFTPTTFGAAAGGVKAGDKTPGALPSLSSIDFWRHAGRRVHQGRTRASDWPFTGPRW